MSVNLSESTGTAVGAYFISFSWDLFFLDLFFLDALLRPKTFVYEKFDLEVLVLKIEFYKKIAGYLVKFRRKRT